MVGDVAFLQSRTMMADMVQGMADVVVVIDCDGMIRFINTAGEKLTGYPFSALFGVPIGRIVSDVSEDDPQFYRTLTHLMKNGGAEQCVLYLLPRSGKKISATFKGSVVCNGAGKLESVVGVIRNVSEICDLVQEMADVNRTLEEKVKERTAALEKAMEMIRGSIGEKIEAAYEMDIKGL
ncbi:MAG: PAS domain-containing protein [Nitrospiria bacterium]